MSLTLKIITGMILGFFTGLFINILSLNNYDFISTYFVGGLFDIIGSIFISSLKLMVVPLVFFSLSTGVASFDKDKKLSLIAFKTISLYLLTTAVAISLGLLAAIPAVVAYNRFNSDSKKYTQKLENFSKRFLSII